MISISKSEIPEWLQRSPFLDDLDDDGYFEIPSLRLDNYVKDLEDLIEILKISAYFMISVPKSVLKNPEEVFDYFKDDDSSEVEDFLLFLTEYKKFRTI